MKKFFFLIKENPIYTLIIVGWAFFLLGVFFPIEEYPIFIPLMICSAAAITATVFVVAALGATIIMNVCGKIIDRIKK